MTVPEPPLDEYLGAVEDYTRALVSSEPQYAGLYEMIRYHLGWLDRSLAPVQADSGKKLRPALCLLVAEAAGGDWRTAVPAAAAVELIHNFSLVHDDIQDASRLRRHRETVWAIWGTAQAINAGDALLIIAQQALLEGSLAPDLALGGLRMLNAACRALCEGQFLDMGWESEHQITVDQYLGMIERKTARLFQCSAELGAYCARAPADVQQAAVDFGRVLGMAFQAADDLLGVWGPEAETGKTAALDVMSRKKSLPIVLGLSAPGPVADRLRELFRRERQLTATETAEATQILDRLDVRQPAVRAARAFRDEALEYLSALDPTNSPSNLRAFIRAALPAV